MVITQYLAMTAAELRAEASLPRHIAWMSCHFSPYSTGLSNIPSSLPEGSLLILNDRTPIHRHDPGRVLEELSETAARLKCSGILLDLQLPGITETAELVGVLTRELSLPVGVSESYYTGSGAVFLPPIPPDTPAETYLKPWQTHEIWLETDLGHMTVTVDSQGARYSAEVSGNQPGNFRDDNLFCHYDTEIHEESVRFRFFRTREDLQKLLAQVGSLGVTTAVGLYQELDGKLA